MGLGKTIQSIALMAYLKQFKKKNGFFLVIVPKSQCQIGQGNARNGFQL